jgi:hypothetical protein
MLIAPNNLQLSNMTERKKKEKIGGHPAQRVSSVLALCRNVQFE